MPFTQFTIEQIAGDLLPNPTTDQLIATGFHRNTPSNFEGGIDFEQYRNEAVADRTATTGACSWASRLAVRAVTITSTIRSQTRVLPALPYHNNTDEITTSSRARRLLPAVSRSANPQETADAKSYWDQAPSSAGK